MTGSLAGDMPPPLRNQRRQVSWMGMKFRAGRRPVAQSLAINVVGTWPCCRLMSSSHLAAGGRAARVTAG